MADDCLDCAFFECDLCADEYGCCCGRIPADDEGEDMDAPYCGSCGCSFYDHDADEHSSGCGACGIDCGGWR